MNHPPPTGVGGQNQRRKKKGPWTREKIKETLRTRTLLVLCGLLFVLVVAFAGVIGYISTQDAVVPPCSEPCTMDWLYSRNRCYFFSMMYRKEGDWDESQSFCSSHNGSLALFDTQEELNFLIDLSFGHHMWVGLRMGKSEIYWANGTVCSSNLCTITDFGDCAYIGGGGSLWLSGCHLPRPYICTKELYI